MKKKLNHLLKINGKTKKQAADEMGLSRQYFTQICNGKRIPGKTAALKIAKYFDGEITPAELMQL